MTKLHPQQLGPCTTTSPHYPPEKHQTSQWPTSPYNSITLPLPPSLPRPTPMHTTSDPSLLPLRSNNNLRAPTLPKPVLHKPVPRPVSETQPLLPLDNRHTPSTDLSGFLFIALSTLAYSMVSVLVRLAEKNYAYPAVATVFLRGIILTGFSAVSLLATSNVSRVLAALTPKQRAVLVFRGIAGALGVWTQYAAFKYMRVGEVISLYAISPLFTLVLSRFFLGEPVSWSDFLAALLGVSGVALITQTPHSSGDPAMQLHGLTGPALAIASALITATGYVAVRSLGTDIPFMLSIMSLSIGTVVVSVTFGLAFEADSVVVGGKGAAIVVLASLFSFLAQSGLNRGLQLCPAGPGVVICNLDVPLVYVLGLVILGETSTMLPLIGSGMVVLSALAVGLRRLVS